MRLSWIGRRGRGVWEERWDKAGLKEGEGTCRRGEGTKRNWKQSKGWTQFRNTNQEKQ